MREFRGTLELTLSVQKESREKARKSENLIIRFFGRVNSDSPKKAGSGQQDLFLEKK